MSTHYSILGVSSTASHEAIKAAFHRLARTSHPDKQQQQQQQQQQASSKKKETTGAPSFFLSIQKAWETLRDSDLRAAYDDELQHSKFKEKAKRQGAIVLDRHDDLEVAVDDETGETIRVYDCRCGEEVIVEEEGEDDDDNNIMVECPGCCFVYKINNNNPISVGREATT
jgi:curved DNA-binding protein CbpA